LIKNLTLFAGSNMIYWYHSLYRGLHFRTILYIGLPIDADNALRGDTVEGRFNDTCVIVKTW